LGQCQVGKDAGGKNDCARVSRLRGSHLEQVGNPTLELDESGLLDGGEFAEVHLDVVLENKKNIWRGCLQMKPDERRYLVEYFG